MASPPGIGEGAGFPEGCGGGHLGPTRLRMETKVPYTAPQLAPAEVGHRVAAGRADQSDFISFPPVALTLGLGLFGP